MSGKLDDTFFQGAGAGDMHQGPASTQGFDTGADPSAGYMQEPVYVGGSPFDSMPQGLDVMPPPLMYQPRPTDPYTLEESASVMETVRAQFETAIAARAEKEALQAAEVRRRAEEELDGFYDGRTDEVARRQARSREQEEAFLREMHASVEESTSNPWARVCDLVDLKGPVPSSTSSASVARGSLGGESSSRRGAAQAKLDEEDFYRATEKMRSLIIQMKADAAHANVDDDPR